MATEQLFADRYKLDRRLGVGGMATVQLAFDTRLERNVAVKLLAEHLAEDACVRLALPPRGAGRRAARAPEHRAGLRLRHRRRSPGASSSSWSTSTGTRAPSCCATAGRCRRATPSRSSRQACRGLDYAHRNGVVHRDVKPGNLMVNTDGVVKLADFGIAKAAEQSDITKVGSVLGTAAYLSPEQARGEPAGPASDIYALGVVSYQLMAGRLPYEAASLTDLARLQEAGPPPRLQDVGPRRPAARSPPPSPARWRATRSAATRTPPRWRTRCATASPASRRTPTTSRRRARCPTTRRRGCSPRPPSTGAVRPRAPAAARRRAAAPHARRPPAARPPPAAAAQAARRRPGKWIALLLVLALIAGGVFAYQAINGATAKPVELNEDVGGTVDEAVSPSRTWSSTTRADQLTTRRVVAGVLLRVAVARVGLRVLGRLLLRVLRGLLLLLCG